MWTRILAIVSVTGAPAYAQNAFVGVPGTDWSAYRRDIEVWGWSSDFREMALIGLEVQRQPDGRQRGEAYMPIVDVGTSTEAQNVQLSVISYADNRYDPTPLPELSASKPDLYNFRAMWPRRPLARRPPRGMGIEPKIDIVVLEPGQCTAEISLALELRGEHRLQPPTRLPFVAPCERLSLKDVRVVWAKADLGAVTVGFDYGSREHEARSRFALVAAWTRGEVPAPRGQAKPPTAATRRTPDELRLAELDQALETSTPPRASGLSIRTPFR